MFALHVKTTLSVAVTPYSTSKKETNKNTCLFYPKDAINSLVVGKRSHTILFNTINSVELNPTEIDHLF